MRFLPLAGILSGLLLCGCTDADWDHAMTYSGLGTDQQAAVAMPAPAPVPQPQAAAAPDTSFCQAVAKQDAAGDGFDAATQSRVFQRSFQQCVALFGAADSRMANAR